MEEFCRAERVVLAALSDGQSRGMRELMAYCRALGGDTVYCRRIAWNLINERAIVLTSQNLLRAGGHTTCQREVA